MNNPLAKPTRTLALAAVLAAAASSIAFAQGMQGQGMQGHAHTVPAGMERCYGVARAGHNDCAAGAHSCAGQATGNNDPASFVVVPTGVCGKLAHGSTTAPAAR